MSSKQHKEKTVACPNCNAGVGQNCMMAAGTFGRYHQERIAAARGNSYITAEPAPQEQPPRLNPDKSLRIGRR